MPDFQSSATPILAVAMIRMISAAGWLALATLACANPPAPLSQVPPQEDSATQEAPPQAQLVQTDPLATPFPAACEFREDASFFLALNQPALGWRQLRLGEIGQRWKQVRWWKQQVDALEHAWLFGPPWLVQSMQWLQADEQALLRDHVQRALESPCYAAADHAAGPWIDGLRETLGLGLRSWFVAGDTLQPQSDVWLRLATFAWDRRLDQLQVPRIVLAAQRQGDPQDLHRELDALQLHLAEHLEQHATWPGPSAARNQ